MIRKWPLSMRTAAKYSGHDLSNSSPSRFGSSRLPVFSLVHRQVMIQIGPVAVQESP